MAAVMLTLFGGGLLAAAAKFWTNVVRWLLEKGLIVSKVEDPVIRLPRAGGAGLSTLQLVIAIWALVLVTFALIRIRQHTRKGQK